MSDTARRDDRLKLGRVVSLSFGIIGRNLAVVGTVAFVSEVLTVVLTSGIGYGNKPVVPGPSVFVVPIGVGIVANSVFMIAASGITRVVVSSLNGRRTSVAQAFATMLRLAVPLLGLGLVVSPFLVIAKFAIAWNAVFIGFLYFGFGPLSLASLMLAGLGLMLVIRWAVAAPARVVEGPPMGSALTRSGELTAGNRWRVFGLAVVLGLFSLVVTFLLGAIGTALGGSNTRLVGGAAQVIAGTVTTSIGATGIAVLYVELRRVRVGATPSQLAEAFT